MLRTATGLNMAGFLSWESPRLYAAPPAFSNQGRFPACPLSGTADSGIIGAISGLEVCMQKSVPCLLMRGGTSKGAYFLADDLPADPAAREKALLALMGSPDLRQIDGLGGAHPLTSKVAIVRKSERPGVDVDYLFVQVVVDEAKTSTRQNCGNILA